ncbi:MAG: hypothetical protein HRT47_01785 [Candidatus Caenarcaniphilales bacterium]|nr:hypothetical protein [Candidatus Caenarcaniphilales bacterium]
MRHFFSEEDLFQILTPYDWLHRPDKECTYSFSPKPGEGFQISINYLREHKYKDRANKLIETSKNNGLPKIHNFYQLDDFVSKNGLICRMWVKKQASKFIKVSITAMNIDEHLEQVNKCLESFRIVKPNKVDHVKRWYKFGKFLEGMAAMMAVLNKSLENKCYIESVCAYTNLIDAYLRCALILKNQIKNRNKDLDIRWIYQGIDDKPISEKMTYKEAFEEGIINEKQKTTLDTLYNERNRVIHRFIISEISYFDIEDISCQHNKLFEEIWQIVKDLEDEQIALNVGMTKQVETDIKDFDYQMFIKEKLESFTLLKHSSSNYSKK